MKKETKVLVEWIKRHISVTVNDDVELHHKAFDFLNSLPEIENKLCFGGYIQDKNGTPCCDGDQIINPSLLDGEKELGTLYWSKSDWRFYFKKEDKCHLLTVGFEKVKKND